VREKGRAAWVSDHEIRYLLENQTVDLRGTTGAPLLSAEGTLVGMHMGIFTSKAGRKFGYACPAAALLAVIDPSAPKLPSVLKDKP